MSIQVPADSPVWDAWERIYGALYDALHKVDSAVLRFLAEHAENNDLVREVAQDLLDIRAEECTCEPGASRPAKWCPTHGIDPDHALEEKRERERTA